MPIIPRNDLTAEQVRECLEYDRESGIVRWRYNPKRPKEWNTRRAGKPAGHVDKSGRMSVRIGEWLYLLHRVIWLIETGEWPAEEIDHRNGDHSDNRWTNLREATRSQNTMNRRQMKNNVSGFIGVRFRPHHGKWEARISANGRQVWHGYFTSAQEAAAARRAMLPQFHGEFVRGG